MDGRPHHFHNLPLPFQLLHWYQIILLSDKGTYENSLTKVITNRKQSIEGICIAPHYKRFNSYDKQRLIVPDISA